MAEQGLSYSISAVDQSTATLTRIRNAFRSTGDAAKKAGDDATSGARKSTSALKDAERQAKQTASGMRELANAVGAAGLAGATLALGRSIVQTSANFDSLKRGLTAVAGSAGAAERQLARLREVAKLPGLGFEEAVKGSVRLQAAGLSAQMAERALKAFGNALATVGAGREELGGVITALSQIQSKGKVSAEEINQLAERLPQIRQAMKGAFGTSDTEALGKSGLTAEAFIAGLVTQLEKLPTASGGAQNSFENLADATKRLQDSLGKAILPAVVKGVEWLAKHAEDAAAAFERMSTGAQGAFLAIGGGLASVLPAAIAFNQLKAAAAGLGIGGAAAAGAGAAGAGAGAAAGAGAMLSKGFLGSLTGKLLPHAFTGPIGMTGRALAGGIGTALFAGYGLGSAYYEEKVGQNERKAELGEAERMTSSPEGAMATEIKRKLGQAQRRGDSRAVAYWTRTLAELRGRSRAPAAATSAPAAAVAEGPHFGSMEAQARFLGGDTAAGQLQALRPVLQARLADLQKQGKSAKGKDLERLEVEFWNTKRELAQLEKAAQEEVAAAREKAQDAAKKAAEDQRDAHKRAMGAAKRAAEQQARAYEEMVRATEQAQRDRFSAAQGATRGAVGAVGAGVELAKARAAVLGMIDPRAGKAAEQSLVIPALQRKLRAAGVPIPGESQEDAIRRQIEAEQVKGEILSLSGVQQGRSVGLMGGGSMAFTDPRGRALMGSLDAMQRGSTINIGNIVLGGSEDEQRRRWLSIYDTVIRRAVGGL